MRLFKKGDQVYLHQGDHFYGQTVEDWDALIDRDHLYDYLLDWSRELPPVSLKDWQDGSWDPPLINQEVWAAGVTYSKSKTARMEESQDSGGAYFYNLVYHASRPELFYKSNRQRTVGHLDAVNIRKDSSWNVPEPELVLFINSRGNVQGYTIGNDMSSRSIEGENPLYLPQAKVYERCAALGPCLYIPAQPIDPQAVIRMTIERQGNTLYDDQVSISRMKRSHHELVDYLFRECQFPHGVFLMTGTCLVPANDFTLQVEDRITISIDAIGSLVNTVQQTRQGVRG